MALDALAARLSVLDAAAAAATCHSLWRASVSLGAARASGLQASLAKLVAASLPHLPPEALLQLLASFGAPLSRLAASGGAADPSEPNLGSLLLLLAALPEVAGEAGAPAAGALSSALERAGGRAWCCRLADASCVASDAGATRSLLLGAAGLLALLPCDAERPATHRPDPRWAPTHAGAPDPAASLAHAALRALSTRRVSAAAEAAAVAVAKLPAEALEPLAHAAAASPPGQDARGLGTAVLILAMLPLRPSLSPAAWEHLGEATVRLMQQALLDGGADWAVDTAARVAFEFICVAPDEHQSAFVSTLKTRGFDGPLETFATLSVESPPDLHSATWLAHEGRLASATLASASAAASAAAAAAAAAAASSPPPGLGRPPLQPLLGGAQRGADRPECAHPPKRPRLDAESERGLQMLTAGLAAVRSSASGAPHGGGGGGELRELLEAHAQEVHRLAAALGGS